MALKTAIVSYVSTIKKTLAVIAAEDYNSDGFRQKATYEKMFFEMRDE